MSKIVLNILNVFIIYSILTLIFFFVSFKLSFITFASDPLLLQQDCLFRVRNNLKHSAIEQRKTELNNLLDLIANEKTLYKDGYTCSEGGCIPSSGNLFFLLSENPNLKLRRIYSLAYKVLNDEFGPAIHAFITEISVEPIIIDPTYLQFLKKDKRANLPEIFVGTKEDLVNFFSQRAKDMNPQVDLPEGTRINPNEFVDTYWPMDNFEGIYKTHTNPKEAKKIINTIMKDSGLATSSKEIFEYTKLYLDIQHVKPLVEVNIGKDFSMEKFYRLIYKQTLQSDIPNQLVFTDAQKTKLANSDFNISVKAEKGVSLKNSKIQWFINYLMDRINSDTSKVIIYSKKKSSIPIKLKRKLNVFH